MGTCRYVVKFAFDGQLFSGYARQPEGGTVEDELIGALLRARLIDGPREASFASASRVDRGVSALGAAAAFDTAAGPERALRSLNAKTSSLLAHSIAQVPTGYDPRRRASSRWYRYHFPSLPDDGTLDVDAMVAAAREFVGEHDFTAFARLEGRDPRRRVLRADIGERGGCWHMDIVGESFLWNQVRRMASAVLMVGMAQCSRGDIASALGDGPGGPFPPLPAHGLFLMDVAYEGLEFLPVTGLPRGTGARLAETRDRAACKLLFHEYLDRRMADLGVGQPGPESD